MITTTVREELQPSMVYMFDMNSYVTGDHWSYTERGGRWCGSGGKTCDQSIDKMLLYQLQLPHNYSINYEHE